MGRFVLAVSCLVQEALLSTITIAPRTERTLSFSTESQKDRGRPDEELPPE